MEVNQSTGRQKWHMRGIEPGVLVSRKVVHGDRARMDIMRDKIR